MRNSVLVSTLAILFFAPMINAANGTEIAVRSQIGMPCSSHKDCGKSQHCIDEKETRNRAHFVGGYCVKFDCSYKDPCDFGSMCVEPEGKSFSLCLARCSSDAHCRNGYACHGDGVCLPAN